MIVDVRLLGVLLLFFPLAVVMAVRQRVVIVVVRMPIGTMLELPGTRLTAVMMRDMVMIVAMHIGGVSMFWRAACAFRSLLRSLRRHREPPCALQHQSTHPAGRSGKALRTAGPLPIVKAAPNLGNTQRSYQITDRFAVLDGPNRYPR